MQSLVSLTGSVILLIFFNVASTQRLTVPDRKGFTLVELMIVVVVIGVLASLAIPAFEKIRRSSYASRIMNDFRTFRTAFETHALETGSWAPDGSGNDLPATVRPYLQNTAWFESPALGGYWDWEYNRLGYRAAIGLAYADDMPQVMEQVDEQMDDGDLSTGRFVKTNSRYLFVLEE